VDLELGSDNSCPFVYTQATKLVFAEPDAAMAIQSFAFPGSPL